MVIDDLGQQRSQILQGLMRVNRLALAQLERTRGGTRRIAVPFTVSGDYADPIGLGVICPACSC